MSYTVNSLRHVDGIWVIDRPYHPIIADRQQDLLDIMGKDYEQIEHLSGFENPKGYPLFRVPNHYSTSEHPYKYFVVIPQQRSEIGRSFFDLDNR
jgi:hypothetical protein